MTRMHCRLTTLVLAALVAWPQLARAQQPITVSGTVVNETGQPMPGASVALLGLGLGAMTDDAGKYSFLVEENSDRNDRDFLGTTSRG